MTSHVLSQLFHPVGILEEVWHCFVEARDDFVDGFLPRLFRVFVETDCFVELAQSRLQGNENEEINNLITS